MELLTDPLFFMTTSLALILCVGYGLYIFREYPNNRSFLNSIPSFCTGVGVFFTFVALFISLAFLQDSDDLNVLELIPQLVSAFSTSIIGVASSLIFGFRVKKKINELDIQLAQDKPYLNIHPNELLHNIQKGIEVLNSESEGLKGAINGLKSSNEIQMSALSNAIGSLVESVNSEIKQTVKALQEQLENYIETIGNNAINASTQQISTINEQFLTDTQALIKGNQEQLSTQFGAMENVFTNIVSKIEGLSNGINQQTETTQTSFNTAINEMIGSLQSQSNQLIENTENQSKELLLNTQNQLVHTINETNTVLEKNLENLEKTFSNIEKWQNTSKLSLEEVTNEFVKAVSEYQSIGEQNKLVLEEVKKQLVIIEALRTNEDKIIETIGKYDSSLNDSLNKVNDVHTAISKLGKIESRLAQLTQ
jgi:hypothetical protein